MAIQNFYTFVEVDPTDKITIDSSTQVSFTLDSSTAYLYKDEGTWFLGDFEHKFNIYKGAPTSGSACYIWILSNSVQDRIENMGNCLYIFFDQTYCYLCERYNGVDYATDGVLLNGATNYYPLITRTGSTLTLKVYSDALRTIQVGSTKTLNLHSVLSYQYIYALLNLYYGMPQWDGILRNFDYGGNSNRIVIGSTLLDRLTEISIEQSCDVALRDVPLRGLGEIMDTGTYLIHPLKLTVSTRLSDSEKTSIENRYNDRVETIVIIGLWTFTGWFRDKEIVYEYKRNRPWKARLTFDIYTYEYSGSSVGTFSNQQLRLVQGATTLDYQNIIDFLVGENTTIAIPNWVNQAPSIDLNIWNKKLKHITYTVRDTEYRLYELLQMLTSVSSITLTDYIHGPTNKTAWLISVRAVWNPLKKFDYPSLSFISTPWEVEFELIVQE